MKSIVKEIAVYRTGCFISRNGTVNLHKGHNSIVLDTLPQTLDQATLTLSLPEDLSGSNVQVQRPDQEWKEGITEELEHRIKEISDRIDIKKAQIEMWKTNADFSARESLNVDEMSSYIEKLPERLESIYTQIGELEKEQKALNRQLKEKKKDANVVLVKADIEAPKDGDYPFALRYLDHNAGWYPIYEIHTTEENDLSILLKGMITQNTQEDLSRVKVSLYTGNPMASGDIPVLYPNKVDFYQEPQFNGGRMMMKAAMSMNYAVDEEAMAEPMMDEDAAMRDVAPVYGSSSEEDTMTEYELSGLWDIASGKEISINIETKNVPCRYHVIAVPKLDSCGYLAAEVKTADIEELISTSAKVYHKGTYIGEVYVDPDLSKDNYDISLGRDESIRLKRDQKKKYTSNVLLKGQKKTEYEYELKITSSKNKSCSVTLMDQIPVSTDKSIVIDEVALSGAEKEEDSGELTWEFDLGPSETRTFSLAYNISWPKDRKLNI